ncbi:MAG TPA: 4'-phosphopantetheinyl transferase superfamily protein [Longimicrobiales bacterium]
MKRRPFLNISDLETLRLSPGVIHVLRVRLDRPPASVEELAAVASEEERARAAMFLHDRDRHRHIIGRAVLRLVLSPLVGRAAADIRFEKTALGKPYLASGPSFNVSHSGSEILIAIASGGRIGVDVEEVRRLRDMFSLARTSFTPPEVDMVAGFPEQDQLRAFFRVWTRKEAMLKALGCGLTGLSGIRVTADPGVENAVLHMAEPPEVDRWTVRSFEVDAAVEAAFAWDQPVTGLQQIEVGAAPS